MPKPRGGWSTKTVANEETWAAVERDYRLGIMTVTEVSAKYGIKPGTIVQRAQRQGWKRDLSHRVAERTNEKLFREAVALDGESPREVARVKRAVDRQAEAETIEAAAELHMRIIMQHRGRVGKASALCDGLMAELAAQAMTSEQLHHVAELLSLSEGQLDEGEVDPRKVQARADAWKKLMSLGNRTDILKKLADALRTIVTLERMVYGISDNANGEANDKPKVETPETDLPINEVARRVAFTLLLGVKGNKGERADTETPVKQREH